MQEGLEVSAFSLGNPFWITWLGDGGNPSRGTGGPPEGFEPRQLCAERSPVLADEPETLGGYFGPVNFRRTAVGRV